MLPDPKETVKIVKSHIDIVSLISGHTNLKQSGRNYIGLCPFHKEKTPSFVVSPTAGNYHCYGCGAHGDAISFFQQVENVNFSEALTLLAERAGIKIRPFRPLKTTVSKHLQDMFACLKLAEVFYRDNFKKNQTILKQFLAQRALSQDILHQFSVGFAPSGRDNLVNFLTQNKVSPQIIEECGLARTHAKWGLYDFFKNRLIFSIHNEEGQPAGFAGRALGDDHPKYINSPDNEVYHKSSILYGIDLAQTHWRKKRRAIIVEGYFDVIRMHQHGFLETAATCGTTLTIEQIRILKRQRLDNTYLLFDNDNAGYSAALKATALCLTEGLPTSIALIKEAKDPDEFLKPGTSELVEKLEKLLANAANAEDFYLNHHYAKFQKADLNEQLQILDDLLGLYQKESSNIKYDLWSAKIAKTFEISKSLLQKKPSRPMHILPKKKLLLNPGTIFFELKKLDKDFKDELTVLRMMVKFPESFAIFKDLLAPEHFREQKIKTFYQECIALDIKDWQKAVGSDLTKIFNEHHHLCSYIIQTATTVNLSEFEKEEAESLSFKIISAVLRQQLDDKLRIISDFNEQAKLVKNYKENLKKIASLNHKKITNKKSQYNRHYER